MADTSALGADAERRAGSTPALSTLDAGQPGPAGQIGRMLAWLRRILTGEVASPEAAPDEPVPKERAGSTRPPGHSSWIGVDLDGTLASADSWKGMEHIGEPVPLMLRRVRAWREKGLTVKVVTARAGDPVGLAATKAWLERHGLGELEVTDRKDFGMLELWDDRAIQVVHNAGICFLSPSAFGRPRAPILPDEVADRTYLLVGAERFDTLKPAPPAGADSEKTPS